LVARGIGRSRCCGLDLEVKGAECLLVLQHDTFWLVAGDLPPDPWWILDWSLLTARPFDKAPRSHQLKKKIASLPL
jgi:hypothetical protein